MPAVIKDPKELADLIERAERLMVRFGGECAFHKLPDDEAALIVEALRAYHNISSTTVSKERT